MKTHILWFLLLASCASTPSKPVAPAASTAPVVTAISAPTPAAIVTLQPDTAALRSIVQDASARAAKAEFAAATLKTKADAAQKSADAAFSKGLAAGSKEAADNQALITDLRASADQSADLATKLFRDVQGAQGQASDLSQKVTGLETTANQLRDTNLALAKELVQTRQQSGSYQDKAADAQQAQANAVASATQLATDKKKLESQRDWAWGIGAALVLGIGALFVFKIAR